MEKFYSSFTFMLGFMITTLIFSMTFGQKFAEYFLLLVLLSMVVLNADKLTKAIGVKTE